MNSNAAPPQSMCLNNSNREDVYDDSASGIGSEVSYASHVGPPMPMNMSSNDSGIAGIPLMQSALGTLQPAGIIQGSMTIPTDTTIHGDSQSRARPGKRPAKADEELTEEELRRRNRRRMRNREAAQRCRERRIGQIDHLQSEVTVLKNAKDKLAKENESLKAELEKLKFQLTMQHQMVRPQQVIPVTSANFSMPGPVSVPSAVKVEPARPAQPAQVQQQMPYALPLLSPVMLTTFNPQALTQAVLTPGAVVSGGGVTPLQAMNPNIFTFPPISAELQEELARKSSLSAFTEMASTL